METSDTFTKFNAGVAIALQINDIVSHCEYYARIGDFTSWFNELRILERRILSKARKKAWKDGTEKEQELMPDGSPKTDKKDKKGKGGKKASDEIELHFKKGNEILSMYNRKFQKGKKINNNLSQQVYNTLADYEIVLRKWVDELGYGMPENDDPSLAAWN